MPSGPIQTLPAGLLSALELKNMGNNPVALRDDVQPVIDLTRWYGNQDIQVVGGFGNFSSALDYAGFFNVAGFAAVPEGEMWWVRQYTASLLISDDATDIELIGFSSAAIFREVFDGPFAPIRGRLVGEPTSIPKDTIVPANQNGFEWFAPSLRDFWAPPGTNFGAILGTFGNTSANDWTLIGSASINRFKI